MSQEFLEYRSVYGYEEAVTSDNYLFTPNGTAEPAWAAVRMEVVEGQLLSEIRQYFYRWGRPLGRCAAHGRCSRAGG